MAPDTIYFIDDGSHYGLAVKSSQFVIKTIDLVEYPEMRTGVKLSQEELNAIALRDEQVKEWNRIKERATSTIEFNDYASGIRIYNAQGELVAKDADIVFAAH